MPNITMCLHDVRRVCLISHNVYYYIVPIAQCFVNDRGRQTTEFDGSRRVLLFITRLVYDIFII